MTGDGRNICQFLDRGLSSRHEGDPHFDTDCHVYQERFWNAEPSKVRGVVDDIMATGDFEIIYQQHGVHVLKHIEHLPPPPDDLF